jgi:SAM-dependent methyltransferase
VKKLVLERFFIGTVEQFENVNARGLMNKNRDARVVVRRVYINEKVSKNPAFERDIGFHETEPECLTEGIYEQGFLTHGRVSTNDARGEAAQIISVLEKYSPAYLARSDEQLRRYERSAKGWEEFYNARRNRTTVWKDDPSPILHAGEKLELLLSNILGEQDDLDRNSCIIVDAGCGDGINLKYCIEVCRKLSETFYNVRFDVTGVDFSPTAVDICKKNLEVESRPQFVDRRVVCRDILEEIPAVTDTVDLLFCANTFSHLHPGELNNALTEWRRVLRIGGRLLFNVYSTDDDTHLQCQEAARKRLAGCSRARQTNAWWYQDKYYKYYERDEIERIIRDAKFRVDAIRRMEWTDPAHDEYRPQPHVHRSWVVEATCTS